ncbi:hypothetical protein D3C72_151410 [compost metagenome]
MEDDGLPLPAARCLSKEQAASYLGIGVTLLNELGVPCIKFGRRSVFDKVDLDAWLDEYKQRGRAGKEFLWPEKLECSKDRIQGSIGLTLPSPTASAYAKALGLKAGKKLKPISPSSRLTPIAKPISELSPSDLGKKPLSGISQ